MYIKRNVPGARDVSRLEPPLAAASALPRWLLWAYIGFCGLLWAYVGYRGPALAVVGFRGPALAVVGFCKPALARWHTCRWNQ
jgi:hypothetical protein